MIPTAPEWQAIVNALYVHYGSYKRILNDMAEMDVYPDYSTLSHLRSGVARAPVWATGAALLNLHARLKA